MSCLSFHTDRSGVLFCSALVLSSHIVTSQFIVSLLDMYVFLPSIFVRMFFCPEKGFIWSKQIKIGCDSTLNCMRRSRNHDIGNSLVLLPCSDTGACGIISSFNGLHSAMSWRKFQMFIASHFTLFISWSGCVLSPALSSALVLAYAN